MNCDALVVEDPADRASRCLPQMRTALTKLVSS